MTDLSMTRARLTQARSERVVANRKSAVLRPLLASEGARV